MHKEVRMLEMWLPSQILHMKARWCEMMEEILLQLFILSFFTNVFFAIIIIILLIAISINIYKENHISILAN